MKTRIYAAPAVKGLTHRYRSSIYELVVIWAFALNAGLGMKGIFGITIYGIGPRPTHGHHCILGDTCLAYFNS